MQNVELFKHSKFYQDILAESYQRSLAEHRPISRYSKGKNVYEIRDANASDIANIALRDKEMSSFFLNNGGLAQRVIAPFDKPDAPIGFYLVRK